MSLPWAAWRRAARVDPLRAQAARLLKVGLEKGFPGQLALTRSPLLLRALSQHGLNAAMLHEAYALLQPGRVAIVDEHRSLDYRQANEELNAFAAAISALPRPPGGLAIALAIENRAEYLLAWFAAMRLGARVLHLGAHVTVGELEHLVTKGRASVLVASAQTAAAVRQLVQRPAFVQLTVAMCGPERPVGAERSWAALTAEPAGYPSARRRSAESVVFTSGTTGRPKGAIRDFVAFGPRELSRVLEGLPFECGERHLVVGPLHHSAPQVFALLHTALGSTVYLAPRFDALEALQTLSKERIHSVFMVPTMLRRVLELPGEALRANPTPALRALVVGSSEFPVELRTRAISQFGVEQVFDFYGATELGWVTLIRGDEMLAHPGSVGRPLGGQQLRIVDGEGRLVPVRSTGRIEVRNAQTMVGYAEDRASTDATMREGWCTVDDLGWLDEAGYVYLAGRARDMVKSGGVNVYPAEIEQALREDETILEVAVIGLPDAEWGERVVAVVVPRDATATAEQWKARVKVKLSPAKVPRQWVIVEALPRNANGKVLKQLLREQLGDRGP